VKSIAISVYGFTLLFHDTRETYPGDTENFKGCFTQQEKVLHVGVFDSSHNTLVHEIFHAVVFVADYIGQRLNSETDEPFAYLIDWIYNELQGELK